MKHTKDLNLLCPGCEYHKAQKRLLEAELKASRWMTRQQADRIKELEDTRDRLTKTLSETLKTS